MILDNVPYTNIHELNLDWVLREVKKCIEEVKHMREYIDSAYAQRLENIMAELEALEAEVTDLTNGKKIPELVDQYLQGGVYFGLTESGYFYASKPEGWKDITFNTTGLDIQIPGEEFGHLVLSY